MSTRYALMQSPVGELLLVGDDRGLLKLSFVDDSLSVDPEWDADPEFFSNAIQQLDEYFAGKRRDFDVAIHLAGSEFQTRVWQALRTVPYGRTATYGQIARLIGNPRASRAVGQANNRNPIAIIVPCHRIIGTSGDLVGYGGGMQRKVFLLNHEAEPEVLAQRTRQPVYRPLAMR